MGLEPNPAGTSGLVAQREAEIALPPLTLPQRRPTNLRSLLLGMLGVVLICGITPYNNYALNNTDTVGNFLPTGLLLFFLTFVMVINAALWRWLPRWAFSRAELGVAMAMMLVSCTFPAGGLMRYLPGNLTGIYRFSGENAEYRKMLEAMNLPQWIFPTFTEESIPAQANEPVVQHFVTRAPVEQSTFAAHWNAVPWVRWATPAVTWGIFLAALYGALLGMTVIFRRQWMHNERLPFPLASVLSSLIEEPKRGRVLNDLLRSRSFWVAFLIVFGLHALNALNTYHPKVWPAVPLKYDLTSILSEEPYTTMDEWFKHQTIYFTVVGVTYFIEARLAFSLWLFFCLSQFAHMGYGGYGMSVTDGMRDDQFFGSLLPYALAALFVARGHLVTVGRQMLRGWRDGEPAGRYLPYGLAGWIFVACMVTMVVWLKLAGCTVAGAIVLVLMVMLIFFTLTRIIAETGLLYVSYTMNLNLPWQYTANQLPAALATRTNLTSNFFGNLFTGVLTHDVRQSFTVYASNAVAVADPAYESTYRWRKAAPLLLSLVAALIVGYVVSGAATLYVEYAYASTLDKTQGAPINGWGAMDQPHWWTMEPLLQYVPPKNGPTVTHDRLGHFGFAAGTMSTLTYLRLRFAGFPLHPLGYLLCGTLGIRWVWFSIFLGWLLKTSVLRFGGGGLYRRTRAFCIGLIIGECGAAAFWLVVAFVRAWLGMSFEMIQVLLT